MSPLFAVRCGRGASTSRLRCPGGPTRRASPRMAATQACGCGRARCDLMVCQLIILTLQGILPCGATGDMATNESFTPGYQRVFDSEQSRQFCVPTDDMEWAMERPFSFVAPKLRADAVPLSPVGRCPR